VDQELNIPSWFIYEFTKMQKTGGTSMRSASPVLLVDPWISKGFKVNWRERERYGCGVETDAFWVS
jgi:hypothetical protein